MHPSDAEKPLWRYVRELERQALEEWRVQHATGLTLEGAMAQRITEVETTVTRRPAGNISVTVSVLAKNALECEVSYFPLQRAGNKLYKLVEPA